MKVRVLGRTGTVGSQVVRELGTRGASVTVLTRDAAKATKLPAGVTAIAGDLLDPVTIRSAFRGMDGVFLLNAVSTTETHEGLMAVNGATLAGVAKLVYMSVHHVDRAPHLPHFGSKIGVEAAIRASGIPATILRPNNFFQNDVWYKQAMLEHGVYPQPIGNGGLSRVDVRDIAEAAAIALTTDGHAGETYDLVGPDVVTGSSTAATWGEALGRPIGYGGDNLDAWEEQNRAYIPAWMAFDFRRMYEFFQTQGLQASAEALRRLSGLLGHVPRRFADFARETAQAWKNG